MDKYEVIGGKPLQGVIESSGSKNAALPLMAATLLSPSISVLRNVPNLQDIRSMSMVLRVIGADVRFENNEMAINAEHCSFWEAPYELVRKMRASFYVLGPLVARFGKAKVSLPGGCALGPRPVDLHIKAMKKLGCTIDIEGGYVIANCPNGLIGTRIDLDIASVGATGNTLMAAVLAKGETTILNAAKEPEIVELAQFLRMMGAKISGEGTSEIAIQGVEVLKGIEWDVIPDRIEIGTFMIAAALTHGNVTIKNVRTNHLSSVIDKLIECGVEVTWNSDDGVDSVTVNAIGKRIKAADITSNVFPSFPTDLQAPWTALMSIAEGSCNISDKIYPDRFNHVPELQRLGADITTSMGSIHVKGVEKLKGAAIMCSDIRAAAALVIAATAAQGKTEVLRIYHLDRGYDKMESKLQQLGADVKRLSD